MAIVTVTCWIEGWSAKLDLSSTHEAERYFTIGCKLYDRDRYKLGGAIVDGVHGYIRRKLLPRDGPLTKALGLEPDRTYDVPPGELCPLGAAWKIDDFLEIELYPGESVFDELWTRSVYGGLMPSVFQIGIRGDGESWQDSIQWDTARHPKLPIMMATFSLSHSFPPLPPVEGNDA